MSAPWTSFHVFQHDASVRQDELLSRAVQPALQQLAERGELESWFFIRYWEGGPHLRLRLKSSPAGIEHMQSAIRTFIDHLPSSDQKLDPLEYYARHTSDPQASVERYGWREDRTIAEEVYVPETERYGGVEGLAISEDLFCASSRVAMRALQLVSEPKKRLVMSFDFLLAFVEGIELEGEEAVGWLRSNVNSWPKYFAIPNREISAITDLAEKEYLEQRERWLSRLAKIRESAAAAQTSIFSHWRSAVTEALRRYREVAERGALTMPPLEVLRSQLHMMHNRLGLTIPDECQLEWLAAFVYARAHPRGTSAEDGGESIDRLYHETSKLSAHTEVKLPGAFGSVSTAPLPQPWPRLPDQPLPEPATGGGDLAALVRILHERRTRYVRYEGSLPLEELAALLRHAAGYLREQKLDHPLGEFSYQLRTYPSAGARHPIYLYVLARRVPGLEPALYCYDSVRHRLLQLGPAPDDKLLLECSPFLSGRDQGPVIRAAEAPAWIFPVANLTHQRERYGYRALRLALLECGHLTQNILLAATALRLACIPIAGFYDDRLNQVLSLDGVNQTVLYMLPLAQDRAPNQS